MLPPHSGHPPAVPRGGGTSGLFGAVLKKGGIVMDMRRLSSIQNIDFERNTVTVQAGITCGDLTRSPREHGPTLKTYASSTPTATIGGWLTGSLSLQMAQ